MGRGRQKAKQTRMARKLKYLTTDTDYDELAKELSSQTEETPNPADPFANVEGVESSSVDGGADDAAGDVADDDLDEYAQWAAQAAAQAAEKPEAKPSAMPKHKPIPMPVPSALKPKKD